MTIPTNVLAAESAIQQLVNDKKLSNITRNKHIGEIRAQALSDQLYDSLSQAKEVTLGEWEIYIDSVSYSAGQNLVELFGVRVRKNGVDIEFDPHRQFANPPLLFPDPDGSVIRNKESFRIDPAAVILNEIIEAAKAVS